MGKKINETASAGSMGSGSIAVAPNGGSDGKNVPLRLRDFMIDFLSRSKSSFKYKPVPLGEAKSFKRLEESSRDLNGIFSQLKSNERQGVENNHTVTYGVEDDNNNLMKVTVSADQAEEFEQTLSKEMAEVENFKATGTQGKNVSMAELLYDLKDKFNIVDVEFPTIPKDMVYNADQATEAVDEPDTDMGGDDFGDNDDSDFGDSENSEVGDGEESMDDDSVEDFDDMEGSGESDIESILNTLMSTLKAQADAAKAKADADAEKARAIQSKYSQQAAESELQKQEQLVKVEAEMDKEKQKEKEAKKIANIAKHNYGKSKSSFGEGFSFSPLMQSIFEVDEFESMNLLRRQKANLRIKYGAEAGDSPELRRHKQEQLRFATAELNAKIRAVQSRDNYDKKTQDKEDKQQDQLNNRQQNNRDAGRSNGDVV